jgi:hypothetical protein
MFLLALPPHTHRARRAPPLASHPPQRHGPRRLSSPQRVDELQPRSIQPPERRSAGPEDCSRGQRWRGACVQAMDFGASAGRIVSGAQGLVYAVHL